MKLIYFYYLFIIILINILELLCIRINYRVIFFKGNLLNLVISNELVLF